MTVYLDSSVVLRWLLQQPGAMDHWGDWDLAVTSALTRAECRRNLDRLRVRGSLADRDVANFALMLRATLGPVAHIPLTPAVLERAGAAFPTELGTLDAIHLATALAWIERREEPLLFLTHDRQLSLTAQACGLDVAPPFPRRR